MYFYRMRGDKVGEFWLLASVDFDFEAKGRGHAYEVTSVREPRMPEAQVPRRTLLEAVKSSNRFQIKLCESAKQGKSTISGL